MAESHAKRRKLFANKSGITDLLTCPNQVITWILERLSPAMVLFCGQCCRRLHKLAGEVFESLCASDCFVKALIPWKVGMTQKQIVVQQYWAQKTQKCCVCLQQRLHSPPHFPVCYRCAPSVVVTRQQGKSLFALPHNVKLDLSQCEVIPAAGCHPALLSMAAVHEVAIKFFGGEAKLRQMQRKAGAAKAWAPMEPLAAVRRIITLKW
eukprot:TRINITY_DN4743_c0_g1_i1.p1 TRINITY_DN4743_c0_g1~~TRINITY_DN4743_c0_g1_i1.p1  ORF type:complete len:208 (+),score=26.48 TRINITY_DN4743_c0_g1_i1:55-678(+)